MQFATGIQKPLPPPSKNLHSYYSTFILHFHSIGIKKRKMKKAANLCKGSTIPYSSLPTNVKVVLLWLHVWSSGKPTGLTWFNNAPPAMKVQNSVDASWARNENLENFKKPVILLWTNETTYQWARHIMHFLQKGKCAFVQLKSRSAGKFSQEAQRPCKYHNGDEKQD